MFQKQPVCFRRPFTRMVLCGGPAETRDAARPHARAARYEALGSTVIPRRARPGLAGLRPYTRHGRQAGRVRGRGDLQGYFADKKHPPP